MREHRHLKNVATLRYDPAKCTGCGMCAEVCPHRVFQMENGSAGLTDRDLCMECGACAKNCPFAAVSVQAGVGCAWAIMISELKGRSVPSCG
jgi:ferredoxin